MNWENGSEKKAESFWKICVAKGHTRMCLAILGRGEVKLEQMGVLTHILPVVVLARGYAIVRATFLINITSRRNSRNSLVSQRLYV